MVLAVISLDMVLSSHHCFADLQEVVTTGVDVDIPKRLCAKPSHSPSYNLTFHLNNLPYQRVCGKVTAYQKGTPDAFYPYSKYPNYTVDDCYADGILLSTCTAPRKHIWTLAASSSGDADALHGCPCVNRPGPGTVPSFVGNDFFCETSLPFDTAREDKYYLAYPLWDGEGFGTFPNNQCFGLKDPWFKKTFESPITDDIWFHLCADEGSSNEDILIEQMHIYIQ